MSHVAVYKHSMCFIQYAMTKFHEWNAHEIPYKLTSFLFSLNKQFLTYGGHMDNCNAKLLCKLAAPYMYLYCNNGQFFMFFIIKRFIFQKV